jgi:hypothetical protein
MPHILVRRSLRGSEGRPASDYMRVVLAHITHKIVIRSINPRHEGVAMFSRSEIIKVEYDVQPSVDEDDDIGEIIADAIRMRADLELIEITLSPPLTHLSALRQSSHEHFIYEFDFNFARYIAQNENFRRRIRQSNLEDITIGYFKIGDRLEYSGHISMQTTGHRESSDIYNKHFAFHSFAAALENNQSLRNKVASSQNALIQMSKTRSDAVDVRVIELDFFRASVANPDINKSAEDKLSIKP